MPYAYAYVIICLPDFSSKGKEVPGRVRTGGTGDGDGEARGFKRELGIMA